jgi:transposase InsO family protein
VGGRPPPIFSPARRPTRDICDCLIEADPVAPIRLRVGRFRFVIRDRDRRVTAAFDLVFAAEGIKVARTPVRAPQANADAERWVGTVRREVGDRMLILEGRQLVSGLAEYADHYNVHRPHRALGQHRHLGLANQLWSCRLGGSRGEIDSVG